MRRPVCAVRAACAGRSSPAHRTGAGLDAANDHIAHLAPDAVVDLIHSSMHAIYAVAIPANHVRLTDDHWAVRHGSGYILAVRHLS